MHNTSSRSRCHSSMLKLHMQTAPYVYLSGNCNNWSRFGITQAPSTRNVQTGCISESSMVLLELYSLLYKLHNLSESAQGLFTLRWNINRATSFWRKSREEKSRGDKFPSFARGLDPGNEVAWKRGQRFHPSYELFCPPFWNYWEKDCGRYELFFSQEVMFLTTLWVSTDNFTFSQWRKPEWAEFYGGVCVFRWRGVWLDKWQIIPLLNNLV